MTDSCAPVFTQKHYEHLERALAALPAEPEHKVHAVELLCRVFAEDNPKFKREMFTCAALRSN